MKNLNQLKVQEISDKDAIECNGGNFWEDLLNFLLDRDPDYQAYLEHTGQK